MKNPTAFIGPWACGLIGESAPQISHGSEVCDLGDDTNNCGDEMTHFDRTLCHDSKNERKFFGYAAAAFSNLGYFRARFWKISFVASERFSV
jgi:hypothetical protein